MRTYRTHITTGFQKGLRPNLEQRNSGLFVSCINGRLNSEGLEGYIPVITSIYDSGFAFTLSGVAFTFTKRWPFPQLFLTDVGIHIGGVEGIYWVSSLSTMALYDYGAGAVTWPWTCVPIPQRPMFVSGNVMVYFDHNANAYKVVT